MLHENSSESHEERKASGVNEDYRREIFDVYCRSSEPMTDREVMEAIGEQDANNVRPEITRLIQDGLVGEAGKTVCKVTGRTVRTCMAISKVYVERNRSMRRLPSRVVTNVQPSSPGHYWYGPNKDTELTVVKVERLGVYLVADRRKIIDSMGGYWSDKLQPPEYPA